MPGLAYRSALDVYRRLRRWKNQLANLVDPPVLVLIYHRVAELPCDPHLLAVSPENFRAQMRFLKAHFPLVRFDGNWAAMKCPAVAVTFDDGYADNALQALPILEEIGVPATFFVSTGALGTRREFWWDELERLILGDDSRPGKFRLEDPSHGRIWLATTWQERLTLHREIHSLMGTVKAACREVWLEQLRSWAGLGEAGRETNRPMSQDELRSLVASPWATVGAHTVSHTPLAILSEDEQRQEIFGSKRYLEKLLDREVTVFSYPFGRKMDYDRTSLRLCREAGFHRVAANFPGQAHRWTDPMQIPRQLVRNFDIETFSAKMKSLWT